MADKDTPGNGVEVSGGTSSISQSINMGDPSDAAAKVRNAVDGRDAIEVDKLDLGDDDPEEKKPDDGEKPKPDGEGEGDDDDKDGDKPKPDGEALPEFDAAKPEVVTAYDARFKSADKNLNLEAFSAEWWANNAAEKPGLNEGTYAYLATLGVTKEAAQQIEAGLVSKQSEVTNALYTQAGGKDNLTAAIEWAKADGGYSPEQKARFNAATGGRDQVAASEAVDLLMVRFERASKSRVNPSKKPSEEGGGGGNRAKGHTDGFATKADWLAARKEAGKDINKQTAVSAKFRKSDTSDWD